MAQVVRTAPIVRQYAVTTSDSAAQNNGRGFSGGLWANGAGTIKGALIQDTGDGASDVTVTVAAAGYVPGHWLYIRATGTTVPSLIGYQDSFEGQWGN